MAILLRQIERFGMDWALHDNILVFNPPNDNKEASKLLSELSDILYTYSDYIRLVNNYNDDVDSGQLGLQLKPGCTWTDLERAMETF